MNSKEKQARIKWGGCSGKEKENKVNYSLISEFLKSVYKTGEKQREKNRFCHAMLKLVESKKEHC